MRFTDFTSAQCSDTGLLRRFCICVAYIERTVNLPDHVSGSSYRNIVLTVRLVVFDMLSNSFPKVIQWESSVY